MKTLGEIELQRYLWHSYIDDIFFLWKNEKEKLKEFTEHLNEKQRTIKFTAECFQTLIILLDVTVCLIAEKVTTDLSVKLTDSHQYLYFFWCHPYHCKKRIPYSQAFYLKITCYCIAGVIILKEVKVIERGYSEQEVRKQVLRTRGFSRDSKKTKEAQ